MSDWPISFSASAPGGFGYQTLCITGPRYTTTEVNFEYDEPSEQEIMAKLAKIEAQKEATYKRELDKRLARNEELAKRRETRKVERAKVSEKNRLDNLAAIEERKRLTKIRHEEERKQRKVDRINARNAKQIKTIPCPDGYILAADGARKIGYSKEAIYKAVRENRIKYQKKGRNIYILETDIDAYPAKTLAVKRELIKAVNKARLERLKNGS